MPLTFESHVTDEVAVIRCTGRITLGPEVQALEQEIDRHTEPDCADRVKRVVLQLAETEFLDSSGLGTLVRLYGILRSAGGGLTLCQVSPRVMKVIEMTNLAGVFPPYASEAEAIESFSAPVRDPGEGLDSSKTRIVCFDTSKDLIAGLKALLTGAGYEVFTTRFPGDAVTLVKTMRPKAVICGPGVAALPNAGPVIDSLRQAVERVLSLPADFYTAEAGQAGQAVLAQVQDLLAR